MEKCAMRRCMWVRRFVRALFCLYMYAFAFVIRSCRHNVTCICMILFVRPCVHVRVCNYVRTCACALNLLLWMFVCEYVTQFVLPLNEEHFVRACHFVFSGSFCWSFHMPSFVSVFVYFPFLFYTTFETPCHSLFQVGVLNINPSFHKCFKGGTTLAECLCVRCRDFLTRKKGWLWGLLLLL